MNKPLELTAPPSTGQGLPPAPPGGTFPPPLHFRGKPQPLHPRQTPYIGLYGWMYPPNTSRFGLAGRLGAAGDPSPRASPVGHCGSCSSRLAALQVPASRRRRRRGRRRKGAGSAQASSPSGRAPPGAGRGGMRLPGRLGPFRSTPLAARPPGRVRAGPAAGRRASARRRLGGTMAEEAKRLAACAAVDKHVQVRRSGPRSPRGGARRGAGASRRTGGGNRGVRGAAPWGALGCRDAPSLPSPQCTERPWGVRSLPRADFGSHGPPPGARAGFGGHGQATPPRLRRGQSWGARRGTLG